MTSWRQQKQYIISKFKKNNFNPKLNPKMKRKNIRSKYMASKVCKANVFGSSYLLAFLTKQMT